MRTLVPGDLKLILLMFSAALTLCHLCFFKLKFNPTLLQALGILRVHDPHHKNEKDLIEPIDHFLLVVTDLIVAAKVGCDNYLPYPLLRYDIQCDVASRKNMPLMHIISAESIYRPAILIPCPDRSYNFGKPFLNAGRRYRQENRHHRNETNEAIRMQGIPYKIIDRAGYSLTFLYLTSMLCFTLHM